MCISPIRIRNPNYRITIMESYGKDISSAYINVPCGHCAECVAIRQMGIVQRVIMEEKDRHLFFATLTYNEDMIPKVTTSTGYTLRYANVHDVQNMIKRLRKNNSFGRPFKYLGVIELGSKRGRPHIHMLFMVDKYPKDDFNTCLNLEKRLYDAVKNNWTRNLGTWRNPIMKPLFTYQRKYRQGKVTTNYDLHYVNPRLTQEGCADVGYYVTKYMMKPSDRAKDLQSALHLNLPDEEYYQIWRLIKPRWFSSKEFGNPKSEKVIKYLKECIKESKSIPESKGPRFINPMNGKTMPLSRYYKSFTNIYSADDAMGFILNDPNARADNVIIDERSITSKIVKSDKFFKNAKVVENNDRSGIFNELIENG